MNNEALNKWKVGRLLNPLPGDREYLDWQYACEVAQEESVNLEVPFGVWLMPDGALDAIAYNGQLFTE